ncbi:MAG: DUF1015 domain-containing protein [Clostridia bacterium]|nr:DUF1015 domain-containing protein [Clostridia bacterium]
MATFRPFRAVRPTPKYASRVAALPYDVMNADEARVMVKDNPWSFLHVDKAEIDLPRNLYHYDEAVYEKAAANLRHMKADGVMEQDDVPGFYIMEQTWNGRTQTGLVGCASIDDYKNSVIKRHENTLPAKETDRIRHVTACNANTGPIFLTYRENPDITAIVHGVKADAEPVYDFTTEDGVRTRCWVISDPETTQALSAGFSDVESLYIADGHHRCASAYRVGENKRAERPGYDGTEEFNYFLAIAFPSSDLAIMDYNRVAMVPDEMTRTELFAKIGLNFYVEEIGTEPYAPTEPFTIGMYYDRKWYRLTAREDTFDKKDPVASLDVSVLQNNLIDPVLEIADPRTNDRIAFIGGIRGLKELERRANSDMDIAFAMYPTTLDQLMDIADAGELMPPKSTWFEPKLLSGLFIHELD